MKKEPESKENLQEYRKRIEEANKKAARWNRVAMVGMCLSGMFMVIGIVLRVVMAMKGVG